MWSKRGRRATSGSLTRERRTKSRCWLGVVLVCATWGSAFIGCGRYQAVVCRAPVQVVDQIDSGLALLVGPGPEDMAWSHDAQLREGMVLSRGVPSEVCRAQYIRRLSALRARLEQKFVAVE